MEGSLSARWMTCLGFSLRCDRVAKVVQSCLANYFQIFPPLVFSYRLFIFTNRGNSQVRTSLKKVCHRKPRQFSKRDRSQMEQPVKKNKFSYFARSRFRLRLQEIWERDLEECLFAQNGGKIFQRCKTGHCKDTESKIIQKQAWFSLPFRTSNN